MKTRRNNMGFRSVSGVHSHLLEFMIRCLKGNIPVVNLLYGPLLLAFGVFQGAFPSFTWPLFFILKFERNG